VGLNKIATDIRPWTEDREVDDILDFDVGIMPLRDGLWELGKCGYKLIQYMACGRPVVASPIGVNRQIVEHGVNGYLAATADEWVIALRTLRDDQGLRDKLGRNGRKKVEGHYCLQVTAPRLAELLRTACSAAPP
jgi:glycosyltransferase involved in cell wall biosynthesis